MFTKFSKNISKCERMGWTNYYGWTYDNTNFLEMGISFQFAKKAS